LDANQAVSFFAFIFLGNHNDAIGIVQSISLSNDKTKEKLVISGIQFDLYAHPNHFVRISRYPMGATEEWIRENAQIIRDRMKFCPERKIKVDIKSGYFTSCSLI
jgi:hypothetical protein